MKGRNILLSIVLLISILITTIVYAAFSTQLNIDGEAIVRSDQDIRITNISISNRTNGAYETYNYKYNKDTTFMYVTLPSNSSITYTVEITNKINMIYYINEIEELSNTNSNISINTSIDENYIINVNSINTFTVTLTNNTSTEQQETLIYKYDFKEKEYVVAFDYNYLDNDLLLDNSIKPNYYYSNGGLSNIELLDDTSAKYGKKLKFYVFNYNDRPSSNGVYYIIPVEIGEKYTFSFYVRASRNIKMSLGHNSGGIIASNIGTEWKRISGTFTGNTGGQALRWYNEGEKWNDDDWFEIHSVEFAQADNLNIEETSQIYGNNVNYPLIPSRTGYSFEGWYTDPIVGTKIDENTVVTGDVTYYAHWTRLTEYSITNIVKNGSYEDGLTNWYKTPSVYDINLVEVTSEESYDGNYSLKHGYSSDNNSNWADVRQSTLTPILGHKYYGSVMFKSSNNFSALDARFETWLWDGKDVCMTYAQRRSISVLDWTKISSIHTFSASNYTSSSFEIRNFVTKSSSVSYSDALIIIDLTETFGEGNEPSKEWCDENINYFEGTTTIYK